jgi:maleamate amidohydrolase
MRVWEDSLSEHDRKVIANRGPRALSGFGERPALLVIDMYRGAIGEDRPIYEQQDKYPGGCGNYAWKAVRHMQKLIPAARETGIPVVYSNNIYRAIQGLPRADDPNYGFSELNFQSEIQPELAMQPGDLLVEKQRASMFFQTGLIFMLLNKKVDSLIIVGNSTSGCVRATAIDAIGYEFKVSVVEECVFDRIEISHKASLFDLHFKYCDVVSVDQTYEYLASIRQYQKIAAPVGG